MIGSRITRREMLRITGIGGIGLAIGLGTASCTTYPTNINWADVSEKDFSLDKFDEWFLAHRLYNERNPHQKIQTLGHFPTFGAMNRTHYSPGIDFLADYLCAIAPCRIIGGGTIYPDEPGRFAGNYVQCIHANLDDHLTNTHVFYSEYAHINKIYPKFGAVIKRGDLIADVPAKYRRSAKLMFYHDGNYVDPNNYGHDHSYMRYYDGDMEEIPNMSQRWDKQQRVFNTLLDSAEQSVKDKLANREHKPITEYHKSSRWDYVEIFRYLDDLFCARPRLFPSLSQDRFAEMKKEFSSNQPIILTLPLKP